MEDRQINMIHVEATIADIGEEILVVIPIEIGGDHHQGGEGLALVHDQDLLCEEAEAFLGLLHVFTKDHPQDLQLGSLNLQVRVKVVLEVLKEAYLNQDLGLSPGIVEGGMLSLFIT